MSNSANLIAELEHEIISTGKLLEAVPENKLDWQPHPKAMTLGELALHVATISGGVGAYADAGNTTVETLIDHRKTLNKAEILEGFQTSIKTAKAILSKVDDEWEKKSWNLTKNGTTIFTIPRSLMVRLLMFNHWYHHRGQLTTYLRILGVELPSVYGPSADVNPFG